MLVVDNVENGYHRLSNHSYLVQNVESEDLVLLNTVRIEADHEHLQGNRVENDAKTPLLKLLVSAEHHLLRYGLRLRTYVSVHPVHVKHLNLLAGLGPLVRLLLSSTNKVNRRLRLVVPHLLVQYVL